MFTEIFSAVIACLVLCAPLFAQKDKIISGVVITAQNEFVPNVNVKAENSNGEVSTVSDAEGNFKIVIANGNTNLTFSGKNLETVSRIIGADEAAGNLKIQMRYVVAPIHEEIVISAANVEPDIERRNEKIYADTLFSRDDQIFQTLDAGINAGQHEGGGKSLEIRRFGFNLDHGGTNGGLKVLTDNVQQNQATQGHGQGYLGSLKSLSPELVKDVEILNGPFSAEYGDFSGLGVVHIKLREDLPQQFTARLQAGSFGTFRTFLAYSPKIKNVSSFLAYEFSRTDGAFENPLDYRRNNLTGNFTYRPNERRAIGFKLNGGTNNYNSSGQLPLDEVFAGRLDRFGFLDPDNGGKVQNGTLGVYFRDETETGRIFKIDGFLARSLFDLWSNFTFFLNDSVAGDEIRQHDSRFQQGINTQFLKPVKFGKAFGIFTTGANFHANQINVGLDRSFDRTPFEIVTKAQANINNYAVYAHQSLDFYNGHLHFEFGLRYDFFTFGVTDKLNRALSGNQSGGKFQPKFAAAYTPSHRYPFTFHFNYGRGITSQDARGIVRKPDSPRLSTTDFYQMGFSYNSGRFSGSFTGFLIDRSNEQVYIPDDDTIEFTEQTRSYGIEAKSSIKINRFLNFNAGLTQVLNAFYPNAMPRLFVDGAPHQTANAGITLNEFRGFTGSLRYRRIGNYRLDKTDENIRAAGFDILDLSLNKRLTKNFDLNFSIDNLANKRYFETQNYFESRICPTCGVKSRIHATPGYPITFTAGITLRFAGKS